MKTVKLPADAGTLGCQACGSTHYKVAVRSTGAGFEVLALVCARCGGGFPVQLGLVNMPGMSPTRM